MVRACIAFILALSVALGVMCLGCGDDGGTKPDGNGTPGPTWTTYNTTNSGLANNKTYRMAIDSSGDKWFATYGGGVSKLRE